MNDGTLINIPVRPFDCDHFASLFICSSTGSQPPYRTHASVCRKCGTFNVWIDGQQMTFRLPSDALVEAAGQYARLLKASEK